MFLDVVGYSALMARDERQALAVVQKFEAVVREQVSAAGGRVVKFLGDGSMAEFPTARAAVSCAMSMQAAIAGHTDDRNPFGVYQGRIGIHAGDLTDRAGDLFGDAVNLAARIQPLADPGGIAMSVPVHDEVRRQLVLRGTRMHGVRLKNLPGRMSVFLVPPARAPYFRWLASKHRRGLMTAGAALVAAAVAAPLTTRYLGRDVAIPLRSGAMSPYAGAGATSFVAAGAGGDAGGVIVLRYAGAPAGGAFCGLPLTGTESWSPRGLSQFTGIKIKMSGDDPNPVQLILIERGVRNPGEDGERWLVNATVAVNAVDFVLPFSLFERDPGYQPAGADNDGKLDLDRVEKLVLQPNASSTVSHTVNVSDLRLIPDRHGRPPAIRGAIQGATPPRPGRPASFSVAAHDPSGGRVCGLFDWGDGSSLTRTAFRPAAEPVSAEHAWAGIGSYSVRVKVVNEQGLDTGWSNPLPVEVRSGSEPIDDLADLSRWFTFAVEGAKLGFTKTPGQQGSAFRIRIEKGGVWGVGRRLDEEGAPAFPRYRGIRLSARGTATLQLRLTLVEQGPKDTDGETWEVPFRVGKDWATFEFPFSAFKPAGDWQPPGADKNGRLNLEKLRTVRFGSLVPADTGEFSVDRLELIAEPAAETEKKP